MNAQIIMVVLLSGCAVVACDKKESAGESPSAPSATRAPSTHAASAMAPASGAAPASSAATEGTKHDPPITPEKVASGHWYCDMGGSVHYSQATEGDGKCDLCKKKLHHKE